MYIMYKFFFREKLFRKTTLFIIILGISFCKSDQTRVHDFFQIMYKPFVSGLFILPELFLFFVAKTVNLGFLG